MSAIKVDTGRFVDLDLIGRILMGAGVVVHLIDRVLTMLRRRAPVDHAFCGGPSCDRRAGHPPECSR